MSLAIDLSGHIAVVTGATGQLGRVMTRTLAACETEAPAGTRVTSFVADVSSEDALLAFRDRIGVRSFNLALWRPPLADDGPASGVATGGASSSVMTPGHSPRPSLSTPRSTPAPSPRFRWRSSINGFPMRFILSSRRYG